MDLRQALYSARKETTTSDHGGYLGVQGIVQEVMRQHQFYLLRQRFVRLDAVSPIVTWVLWVVFSKNLLYQFLLQE